MNPALLAYFAANQAPIEELMREVASLHDRIEQKLKALQSAISVDGLPNNLGRDRLSP